MTTYLCGGINGLSDSDCRNWREEAKDKLVTDTLDPMRRDYRGKEDDSVDDIVKGDLNDIDTSKFILVNATRPSWGTAMEIVYAFLRDKAIVSFTEGAKVSPWLRYHSHHIVQSVGEACTVINKLAAS